MRKLAKKKTAAEKPIPKCFSLRRIRASSLVLKNFYNSGMSSTRGKKILFHAWKSGIWIYERGREN